MMAPLLSRKRGVRKALVFSTWLYTVFLFCYPVPFRHAYGSRMTNVFRDRCHDTLQQHGLLFLFPLWLETFFDLFLTAGVEHWLVLKERISLMMHPSSSNFPLRLWIALVTTWLAFFVSLVASLHLYFLEDTSSLTQAAYEASPLLRFSYDVIYLAALAAGVSAFTFVTSFLLRRAVLVKASLIIVTLVVAMAGFGGLLIRHVVSFFVLFAGFLVLVLLSFLVRRLATMHIVRRLGQQSAEILGACVSVGSMLLVNVVALVLHTILLNPVSHALYMQGQIQGTHLNFTLLMMGGAILAMMLSIVGLGLAFRFSSYSSYDD